MKLNDKVRFLNEKLAGTITRIIDDKMVAVEVDDGFEIPVLRSEIVLEKSDEVPTVKAIKSEIPQGKTAGVYIVLEQRFNTFYYQKIFNYFDCDISLVSYQRKGDAWEYKSHALLKPNNGVLLDNVDFTETNKWPEIFFSVSLLKNDENNIPEPHLYLFKYRSKDYIQVDKNTEGKNVYFVKQESYKAKIKIEVEREVAPSIPQQKREEYLHIDRPEQIVDLHIEKLHTNPSQISAEEALQLQINTFNNSFEKAMGLNYGKITFIHGVGNGTLKNQIWGVLSKSKDIRSYKEAMKEKFGYGATEVIFK